MFARLRCVILLALLASGISGCVSLYEVQSLGTSRLPAAAAASMDQSSHFICWNVHKADDTRFSREMKELLNSIPVDDGVLICLQEVRSTTYERIKGLHREAVSGHYAPSWRRPFSDYSTGVMTVGNHPLPAAGVKSIRSPKRELLVATPKVSLRTEVPLEDGRKLEVINCHGLNFVPVRVLPAQLEAIFAEIRDPESPAILCGDFNTWSPRRLRLLDETARLHGLEEVETRDSGVSPPPKWLHRLKGWHGYDPDLRLDRIYTRGVEVLDCYSDPTPESSDHFPLVLRYKVRPR